MDSGLLPEPSVVPPALLQRASRLAERCAGLDASEVLRVALREEFPGRIALVSAFGADSALLLALAAEVDPAVPVFFLDTEQHFPETLAYRDRLIGQLGLRDVRVVRPDAREAAREDPDADLWATAPDQCCALRKVRPLERALSGFEAWITGRKRFQGGERRALPLVEIESGRIKLNPLAHWSAMEIATAFRARNLPAHPLLARGFLSIGCAPCTQAVIANAGQRSGRWTGQAKTECGIHRRSVAVRSPEPRRDPLPCAAMGGCG
jgi:phosphoadenosine phosphosulfate reductase